MANNDGNTTGRSNRGFAAMDPREQREIARKGGEAVSQDREHMAAIGRKGGEASGGGNRRANPNASRNEDQGLSAGNASRDNQGQFTPNRGAPSRDMSGGMNAGGRDVR
ncbi:hypothetical protein PAGU2638_04600 [Lysobacter sp. PAGU 2638]